MPLSDLNEEQLSELANDLATVFAKHGVEQSKIAEFKLENAQQDDSNKAQRYKICIDNATGKEKICLDGKC